MRPPVFFFLPLLSLSILFLLQDPCFSFVRMGGALTVESKSCNRMSLATALSSSTSTAYAYGGGESLICHSSNAIIICHTVLSSWIVGANTIFRPSAMAIVYHKVVRGYAPRNGDCKCTCTRKFVQCPVATGALLLLVVHTVLGLTATSP